ncbi:MAG TPA: carboxylesterase family protein [Ramlibacter sp.]|nr:carboxylesterase family protein [Ramlibacter sp.]
MNAFLKPDRRKFLSTAAVGLAAPCLLRIGSAAAAEPVTVEIENGKLRGLRADGAISFKGVPYAANTGGANRFLAPQPVANWTGVRDAFEFGDRCVQQVESMSQVPVFTWYGQNAPLSENCCVLNVYAPELSASARRPVMFYMHGGGFSGGGGAGAGVDGSNLAKGGDVVVVTINHRLNVFGYSNLGFLDAAFADAGNAGMLDIVAALTWVRKNIRAFGGDPGNVTIFGQSGGGSKVTTLMTMPAARGLFHRAINMSGVSALTLKPAATAEPLTHALLKELGIDKANVRKIQEVPAERLLAAHRSAVTATKGDDSRPLIDGRHILHAPLSPEGLALHGSVPLMIGTTDTEATLFFRSDMRNFKVTDQQVRARIKAQYDLDDGKADAVMAAYRKEVSGRTAADILAAFATDVLFRGRMLQAAEARVTARVAPTYLYNFNWKMPVEGGFWRSPHAMDIPFAFGNIDKARMMTGPGPAPEEVSRNMMAAFVAFARSGNPNNPRMPDWKPYDTAARATMVIDEKCQLVNDFRGADRIGSAGLLHQDSYQIQRGPLFRYSE